VVGRGPWGAFRAGGLLAALTGRESLHKPWRANGITRSTQANLLAFGSSLAEYVRQIVAYLTFNTEEKPFPFGEWPSEANRAAPKTAKKKGTAKKKPAA
jgi:hypothetical protein